MRLFVASSLALLLLAPAAAASSWLVPGPDHQWAWPRDHHAMPGYRNEWWYLTGQLTARGAGAPTHGVQVTFFRLGLTPDRPGWDSDWAAGDLVMGHLAVTDLARGAHVFQEVLTRVGPGRGGFPAYPDSVLAWVRAPAGTSGRWQLQRRGAGFAVSAADVALGLGLDLDLTPARPRIFQGPGGLSVKDPASGAGSLYFSYPRLQADGRLELNGEACDVTGTLWFDREVFTSQLAARHGGWDWFSLQLDDGRDVMAFALRDTLGAVDATHLTVVEADGTVRWLHPDPSFLTPRSWWTSPETGARYPVAWRLQVPEATLDLEIEALAPAQENVGRRSGIVYWEGAVSGMTAEGAGCRGYAELTGYGGGALPF